MQTITLLLAGAASMGVYVGFSKAFPFAACERCHGSGKFYAPSGKAFRNCGKCRGSGRRKRMFS